MKLTENMQKFLCGLRQRTPGPENWSSPLANRHERQLEPWQASPSNRERSRWTACGKVSAPRTRLTDLPPSVFPGSSRSLCCWCRLILEESNRDAMLRRCAVKKELDAGARKKVAGLKYEQVADEFCGCYVLAFWSLGRRSRSHAHQQQEGWYCGEGSLRCNTCCPY